MITTMKQNYEIELSKCVNSFKVYMGTYQLSIAFLVLKISSYFASSVLSGARRALMFTLFMICFLDCKIFRRSDLYFLLYYTYNFILNFIFSCHLKVSLKGLCRPVVLSRKSKESFLSFK